MRPGEPTRANAAPGTSIGGSQDYSCVLADMGREQRYWSWKEELLDSYEALLAALVCLAL